MLLCCEDNSLKYIADTRPAMRISRYDRLPYDQESALVAVIEGELNLQRSVDSDKRVLQMGGDYTPTAAFNSVDRLRLNRIDNGQLGCFLRSCGCYALESEVVAMVRRIDMDGDQVLSYSEWCAFLGPALAPCPPSPCRYDSPAKSKPLRDSSPDRSPAKAEESSPAKVEAAPVRPYIPRYWYPDYLYDYVPRRYWYYDDYYYTRYPYYSRYYPYSSYYWRPYYWCY